MKTNRGLKKCPEVPADIRPPSRGGHRAGGVPRPSPSRSSAWETSTCDIEKSARGSQSAHPGVGHRLRVRPPPPHSTATRFGGSSEVLWRTRKVGRQPRGWGGRLCSHPPVFLFPLVEGFFPAANVAPLRVNGRGVMGGEGGPPGCTSPLDAFRRREGIIHREKELKLRRKGKGKEPGAARKGPELAATKMSRSEK